MKKIESVLALFALAPSLLCAAPVEQSGVKYDVRAFGAKGDGVTKDTAAFQRAIDAASAAGGGEVWVPDGHYITGSVFLKNDVDFHVADGAQDAIPFPERATRRGNRDSQRQGSENRKFVDEAE